MLNKPLSNEWKSHDLSTEHRAVGVDRVMMDGGWISRAPIVYQANTWVIPYSLDINIDLRAS